ncbi:MAG: YqgE/AlgH family protein, partial [Actinobacteria bacterium]|nr:YqgE/AlgH family protein [Actinomycetota bacterium]
DSVRGKLLLANGSLFGDVFRQTVILMADHDDDGALGYVINRPTQMIVDRDESADHLDVVDVTVYSGGPVQQSLLSVIAEFVAPEHAAKLIFGTVGLLNLEAAAPMAVKRARVFAGYSGWGPGQLEGEIQEGSWVITEPTADLVFGDPEDMWRQALRGMGGEYALMATMPYDPGMN